MVNKRRGAIKPANLTPTARETRYDYIRSKGDLYVLENYISYVAVDSDSVFLTYLDLRGALGGTTQSIDFASNSPKKMIECGNIL